LSQIILRDVRFDFDKAVIRPVERPVLEGAGIGREMYS
jgi:hypothetical protein